MTDIARRFRPTRMPRLIRTALTAAGMATASLGLVGCFSIGGDKAELKVYAPQIDMSTDAAWPALERSLAVGEPHASTALDSPRIAVRPTPTQLQVYAGAIWADTAPAIVQASLVDALASSERFTAVVRPTDAVAAELLLRLDLRHFETVYGEDRRRPTVLVEVNATLIEQGSQRVLGSRRFRHEQVTDKDLPSVVTAFEAALQALATDMTPWVLDVGAGD